MASLRTRFLCGDAAERGLPEVLVLRGVVPRLLPLAFVRAIDFTVFAAGFFAGFAAPFPFCASVTGAAGALSGAAVSFDFFELFAIYFSFTSASLYPQSKAAQAEIGTKTALASLIER